MGSFFKIFYQPEGNKNRLRSKKRSSDILIDGIPLKIALNLYPNILAEASPDSQIAKIHAKAQEMFNIFKGLSFQATKIYPLNFMGRENPSFKEITPAA